jgi:cell division protein FtsL
MDELRQWAMEQFEKYVTKDSFYGWIKVGIPVVIIFVGSCIGYALVNNSNVSAAQTTIAENSRKIDELNVQINRKLDKLLEMAGETEKQARLDAIRRGGR